MSLILLSLCDAAGRDNLFQYVSLEPLTAKGIIRVAIGTFKGIKQFPNVRLKLEALLDPERQIRIRDEVPAKRNYHILIRVLHVDRFLSLDRVVPARQQDRAGVVPFAHQEIHRLVRRLVKRSRHASFDDVEIRQSELLQLLHEIPKLGHGIAHAHVVSVSEGANPVAHSVGADGVDNSFRDFQTETGTVLDGPAPGVVPPIADVLRKLVDQEAVGAVDLDAVEFGVDGVQRRLPV